MSNRAKKVISCVLIVLAAGLIAAVLYNCRITYSVHFFCSGSFSDG